MVAQLKLRRAFRYGYSLFLLFFLLLFALGGFAALDGVFMGMVRSLLSGGSATLLTALAFALSVPLFLACWSLIGSAMLGLRLDPPVAAAPASAPDAARD